MIPRFPPDLLPSLLLLNQIRHTFRWKNRFLSFFEPFTEDNFNFLCTFPIPPTGVLENAKNRFKFGLLFPVYWTKVQKLDAIAICHLSLQRTLPSAQFRLTDKISGKMQLLCKIHNSDHRFKGLIEGFFSDKLVMKKKVIFFHRFYTRLNELKLNAICIHLKAI